MSLGGAFPPHFPAAGVPASEEDVASCLKVHEELDRRQGPAFRTRKRLREREVFVNMVSLGYFDKEGLAQCHYGPLDTDTLLTRTRTLC